MTGEIAADNALLDFHSGLAVLWGGNFIVTLCC